MSIYVISSDRAFPYVYKGTHPLTGEFYIGSRTANNLQCSHLDLRAYKTSSTYVRPRFDEFEWIILAEFFTANAAYDFEQELIYNTWEDPLSLNQSCYYGKRRFRIPSGPRSAEWCAAQSKALIGRIIPPEWTAKAVATRRANRGWAISDETRTKLVNAHTGMKHTTESKLKMSQSMSGIAKTAEHKKKLSDAAKKQVRQIQPIVMCPHCGKTGGSGTMPRWHFDRCPARVVKPILT